MKHKKIHTCADGAHAWLRVKGDGTRCMYCGEAHSIEKHLPDEKRKENQLEKKKLK